MSCSEKRNQLLEGAFNANGSNQGWYASNCKEMDLY